LIPESFKQELLSRVDIVDVIDARVPLKKAGTNLAACCPFHSEKTPSFTVSPTKQFYHCFGCGVHGNAISFLMEYGGLGYIEAMRELADIAGMELPENEQRHQEGPRPVDLAESMRQAMEYYRGQLKRSSRAIDYLKGRGLTGKIAARFGIGYAPDGWQALQGAFANYEDRALVDCGLVIVSDEGRRYDRFRDRIMFPIVNPRGQVIGFGGRVLDSGEPKYLNSPETPLFEKGRELYGLPQAREAMRRDDRCLVVEGYMDVVALAQHGVENVVATLGTATTSTQLLKLLRQVSEIVFCFDGDAAGRKAAWHALEVSLAVVPDGKLIRFLFLAAEHDPDSFVRANGADAFRQAVAEAQPLSQYLLDTLRRRSGEDTPEGRSKRLAEGRPLVQKMVAPLLQMQLVQALAEDGQLAPQELARLYGLKVAGPGPRGSPAAAGYAAGRSAGGGGAFRSTEGKQYADRRRPPAGARLEQELLRAVLAVPELASEISIESIDDSPPEGAALRAVVDYLTDSPPGIPAQMLVEHFRDTEHFGPVSAAYAGLIAFGMTAEGAAADLRGALTQMELRRVRGDLDALSRRAGAGSLTEEERGRVSQLVERMRTLNNKLQQRA
jgi:DNA primase